MLKYLNTNFSFNINLDFFKPKSFTEEQLPKDAKTIGKRFHVLNSCGSGAFGKVYLCYDIKTK